MNEIILKNYTGVSVEIAADVSALRTAALANARAIKTVANAFGEQLAVDALSEIARLLKGVESSRVAVTAPVLATQREIARLAKEFGAELGAEASRLKGELARREDERREQERHAEIERVAAVQRIEQEKARAEREAREIEERKAAAAERANREMQAAKNKQEVIAAVERNQAAQAQAEADAKANAEKRIALAVAPAPALPIKAEAKPEGRVVREVWKFEITDAINFAANNPALIAIIPKTAEINRAIAAGWRSDKGIRIWCETEVSVRAAK